MVKKMNKSTFIEELSKELNYSLEKCTMINEILEHNFVISKKSKDIIINELIVKLDVDNEEAVRIYNISVEVLKREVKKSILHPFKNKD